MVVLTGGYQNPVTYMTKKTIAIFWFRRDLRLHDNTGLYNALRGGSPVLPVFIFDTSILHSLPKADARVTCIYQTLQTIEKTLAEKANSGIALYYGTPLEVFKKITETYSVTAVYSNHDYEPYARKRDREVGDSLHSKQIPFYTFKDHVFFEKDDVVKAPGAPYVVYTPYSRKWLAQFEQTPIETYDSEPYFHNFIQDENLPRLSLAEIGFVKSHFQAPSYTLTEELIHQYETVRDIPAIAGTSKLSVHLRFGTVSIREAIQKARQNPRGTFLKELIWRDFFSQILWHFPHTATRSFKPAYDGIAWRNKEEEFARWRQGETGFPLVDAGMRELNETGFMHNRVRMVAASFLCKHLLVHWSWGEAYFAEKLLDYDMASNVGNWQWVAGCGVDAAPYFRIFNPAEQLKKFDPQFLYIKKWVHEYKTPLYPTEMVNHTLARQRCLQAYKTALESQT